MMSKQHICNCCVTGCSNTAKLKPDLAFFSIPTDKRRDQWLSLISREDLREVTPLSRSRRVCEKHFARDVILCTNTRKTLKRTALPSRCLPFLESYTESKNEEDIPTSSNNTITLTSKLTQTKNNCNEEIQPAKTVVASTSAVDGKAEHTSFYDLCDTFLTKDLASLIKANDGLKFKVIMSDKDDCSQYCFNLHQTSPQAYQFFQNVYGIPYGNFLLQQYTKIRTKVDDSVLLSMKARVDKMSDKEKNCSMLIGSVKLKSNLCYNIKEDKIYGLREINGVQSTEPTTMAIAVMIRGLFFNWKQLIAYILVNENDNKSDIQNWIDSVIKKLFEIGLNVRTLVSSTQDDWICEKSVDNPFFFVDDKKIYHIFDAPDLIKSARDCILLHDFHFQSKVAKYEDIVSFYTVDQQKKLPYAHKLTESHISPKNDEKQEVKYAIQLMSKTVANGIWNYINFELINANVGTVEFISKINDLFDILNVSNRDDHNNERKRSFSEKETKDLTEIVLFFQNLKVINSKNGQDQTASAKFVNGILITVKAIMLLLNDIKTEGYSVLLTRNLHRKVLDDCINRLPSSIVKNPAKLTTVQFAAAFKKLLLTNLKKFVQGGSAKGELTKFLAQTCQLDEEMVQNNMTRENLHKMPMDSLIKILNPRSISTNEDYNKKIVKDDYNEFDTPEKHSLMYICGYLLMKLKKNHKMCYIFKHYLYCHEYETSLDSGKFQRYNQYKKNNSTELPAVPCDNFIQFVEEMDKKFVKAFTSKHLCQRIADSLCKDIEEISFTSPCPCLPKKYLINLFIRIKLFYTIRINNMSLKKNKRRQKCLKVPEL